MRYATPTRGCQFALFGSNAYRLFASAYINPPFSPAWQAGQFDAAAEFLTVPAIGLAWSKPNPRIILSYRSYRGVS